MTAALVAPTRSLEHQLDVTCALVHALVDVADVSNSDDAQAKRRRSEALALI